MNPFADRDVADAIERAANADTGVARVLLDGAANDVLSNAWRIDGVTDPRPTMMATIRALNVIDVLGPRADRREIEAANADLAAATARMGILIESAMMCGDLRPTARTLDAVQTIIDSLPAKEASDLVYYMLLRGYDAADAVGTSTPCLRSVSDVLDEYMGDGPETNTAMVIGNGACAA